MLKYNWLILLTALYLNVYGIAVPTLRNFPLNASSVTKFSTVFEVYSVQDAIQYELSIDTVATFSSAWAKSIISSGPSINGPIMFTNKTYYWRIRCSDATTTSAWSPTLNFSTTKNALTLSKPTNNSTGPIVALLTSQTLGTDTSIRYIYEVDTTNNFSSSWYRIYSATDKLEQSDIYKYGRTLYWRATATNQLGDTLPWSTTWKYTIDSVFKDGGQLTGNYDPQHLLLWPDAGLSTIELQLDSHSTFSTVKLETHWIDKGFTVDTLKDLSFGKVYCYRIRGHYGPHTSKWSATRYITIKTNGAFTTPSTNGEVIDKLLNIYISWGALNGTLKRIQLYADSTKTVLVKDTVTSANIVTTIPELKLNKWYQAHLTYFHSKDTAKTLISNFFVGGDEANIHAPWSFSTTSSVKPHFRFSPVKWATGYIIQIDTGTQFPAQPSSYYKQITQFDTLFGNSLKTTQVLHYNQNYVWRVRPIKDQDTAMGNTIPFKTIGIPINYFPSNNFIGIGTTTDALITTIDSSISVQWELDTTINFTSPILASGTDPSVRDKINTKYVNLHFPDHLLFHTQYFWRCRCISTVDTSEWTAPFSFTTTTNINLHTPANGALNTPINTTLDWSIQGSNLDQRFQYQLATDSILENKPVITLPATHFSEDDIVCKHATTYYWRARAFNNIDTSKWSEIYSFRTIDIPLVGSVSMIAPANGAMISPGPVHLSWNTAANATSYDVQTDLYDDFSSPIVSGNIEEPWIRFIEALPNTKYYWRVRGKNSFGTGPWTIRWFQAQPSVGINETGSESPFKLFPNPASTSFTIESTGSYTIQVRNVEGRLIVESDQSQTSIQTQNWPNGIYIVTLKNDGYLFHQKITILNQH